MIFISLMLTSDVWPHRKVDNEQFYIMKHFRYCTFTRTLLPQSKFRIFNPGKQICGGNRASHFLR